MPGVPQVVDRQKACQRAGGNAYGEAEQRNGDSNEQKCRAATRELLPIQKNERERDPTVRSREKIDLPELDAFAATESFTKLPQQKQRPADVGDEKRIEPGAQEPAGRVQDSGFGVQ